MCFTPACRCLPVPSTGIEAIELMLDKENPTVNRGFAFVTFYNNACAELARKKYVESEHNT
jgi:RNA recognition motif-containing protein